MRFRLSLLPPALPTLLDDFGAQLDKSVMCMAGYRGGGGGGKRRAQDAPGLNLSMAESEHESAA